jgi:uncharacterized OB-fold protein
MPIDTDTQAMAGQACTADHLPISDLDIENRKDFQTQDGQVVLVGSRSASSGTMAFPQKEFCPETGARDMEQITFGPQGTLYSFSTIHISATRETPYTIGYVDFENGLRVLAHVRSQGTLTCDQPVILQADDSAWWVSPVGDVA